jgi:fatty acid desaturase
MIWILEAAIDLVTGTAASAAGQGIADRTARRERRRNGLPEPEAQPVSGREILRDLIWTVGLVVMGCGGLAALDGGPAWMIWGLVGVGLATFIAGILLHRRLRH